MSFDLLDTAFLQRAASPAVPATGVALPAAPATPAGVVAEANRSDSVVVADGVLARLLDSCPDQWWALADHLAAAWQSGSRSIAVAGHAPREGRSTLIHGLELILPVLGCPVRSYESSLNGGKNSWAMLSVGSGTGSRLTGSMSWSSSTRASGSRRAGCGCTRSGWPALASMPSLWPVVRRLPPALLQ